MGWEAEEEAAAAKAADVQKKSLEIGERIEDGVNMSVRRLCRRVSVDTLGKLSGNFQDALRMLSGSSRTQSSLPQSTCSAPTIRSQYWRNIDTTMLSPMVGGTFNSQGAQWEPKILALH